MIELLSENRADIDIMDGSGIAPPDVAWSMHSNYIAKLLLENSAKNSVYINREDIYSGHSLWQIV